MQDNPCQDFKTNLPCYSTAAKEKRSRKEWVIFETGTNWDTSVWLQIIFLTTFLCIITYNSQYTQNPKIKFGMKAKSFQDLKIQIFLARSTWILYQNCSGLYVFLKPSGFRNNIHMGLYGYNNIDIQNNLFFYFKLL